MGHKIGRNDLCFCGSGKKYKKCCFGKEEFSEKETMEDILPSYESIDYKNPVVNENFFKSNMLHEFSAQRFLYSCLIKPEIENIAYRMSNTVLDRGIAEKIHIRETEDIVELIDIMDSKPDSLNYVILRDKILAQKDTAIPLILEEFKKPKTDAFVELGIRIIYLSGIECSEQMIEVITKYNRTAYSLSLFCVLLGFYDNNKSVKVLWDYFHYFREYFPIEMYSDCPLLGLIEIRERKKEEREKNGAIFF